MGVYVYAVGRVGEVDMPALDGVLDMPVRRLDAGSLCVIVSDCPIGIVRAERRNIAANQRVLSALHSRFDVLPMAFGTVTKTEADLQLFLDEHREVLTAQLERIAGAIEMSLRLNFNVADPIAYLVDRTPALQAARKRTFNGRRPPSYDDKIRLGQLCDDALQRYREEFTARVLAIVRDSCAEVMTLPVRTEKEIANLAALVPRSGLTQFEAAVNQSASQIDDDIAFNISGPWPPHNFVQFAPR
jgi:hypothetical protein